MQGEPSSAPRPPVNAQLRAPSALFAPKTLAPSHSLQFGTSLADAAGVRGLDAEKTGVHVGVAGRFGSELAAPKTSLLPEGVDAQVAYRLVHDEMVLDGNPTQNLASFVTTRCDSEAIQLYTETLNKNLADGEEYPQTIEIQTRCARILADLWHASPNDKPVGTATIGSSEAIMLGGLAMKFLWREKAKAAGRDIYHPNIVFGHNCQSALEKFATYFDVEARYVPVTAGSHFCNDPREAVKLVDKNTIGVIMILGSTYTGHFEDVKLMCELLDKLKADKGLDVPVHVDGASGGFVAPFLFPDLEWDFRLSRVVSINTSGHKFGLVYPGLGWIVWRDEKFLPKELVFNMAYLGGNVSSFTLNFSRNAANVILQYYQFVRLGRSGYKAIIGGCLEVAKVLSLALKRSGVFKLYSNIHDNQPGLPVVAFGFSDEVKREHPTLSEFALEHELRRFGWIVPAYNLPPDVSHTTILRVVVRESASFDLMDLLFRNIMHVAQTMIEDADSHEKADRKVRAGRRWREVIEQVTAGLREQKHFPRVC